MLDRIPTPIITPRLLLRPYTTSDAETYYAIHSDPDVRRYLGGARTSREQSDRAFRTYLSRHKAGTDCFLLISRRTDDSLLGDCLLARVPPGDPQLGMALVPSARRSGIAFEAATELIRLLFASTSLAAVVARVQPTNAPSLGLCAKLGFSQVGTQDNHWDETPDVVFRLLRPVHGA